MVIAIEPFLSTKSTRVEEAGDGSTLVGAKGNLSAQYEHTVVVTRRKPIVLTGWAAPRRVSAAGSPTSARR
jgi:methionyl aminopeptidase